MAVCECKHASHFPDDVALGTIGITVAGHAYRASSSTATADVYVSTALWPNGATGDFVVCQTCLDDNGGWHGTPSSDWSQKVIV